MNKVARSALLRSRYFALIGVAGLFPVTLPEIQQAAQSLPAHSAQDDSIEDELTAGVMPALAFDNPRETAEESLLSSAERKRLAREVENARWHASKARNSWLILA